MPELFSLPCTVMRGGTSRALFFHTRDLPDDRAARDRWLRAALGTHDPMRIDGMGGASIPTAKVAVIGPPTREGADLDYLAGIASLDRDELHFDNNCGNILAAVAQFGILAGFVAPTPPETSVRMHNLNFDTIIVGRVPVTETGEPRLEPLFLDFTEHRQTTEEVQLDGFHVTLSTMGARTAMVRAADLGVTGHESSQFLQANSDFLKRVERIHRLAGERFGICTPASPFVVALAEGNSECELVARSVGLGHVHPTMAGTVAVSVGSAARVPGTVPHALLSSDRDPLRLHHAAGLFRVTATPDRLGYSRTARRIMEGRIFLQLSVQ